MEDWPTSGASDTAPRCDNCGSRVSHSFHRVHADEEGLLDGCRSCRSRNERWD